MSTWVREQILLSLELFFLLPLPFLFPPYPKLPSPSRHRPPTSPPPSPSLPTPLPPPLPPLLSSSTSLPSPPSPRLSYLPSCLPSLHLPHSPNSPSESTVDQYELPCTSNSEAVTEDVCDANVGGIFESGSWSLSEASTKAAPQDLGGHPIRPETYYRRGRVSTIYPDDQGAYRNPPLEVERQRSFTGPRVISSSLADRKCETFGVQGLLDELNDIMGTALPLWSSLKFHLTRCISLDYDFGLAYGYLRPHWDSEFDTLAARIDKAESDDAALRRNALDPSKKYITNPSLPPRRVWDLYSNRVIPYYWSGRNLYHCLPVSHSWVAEDQRSGIWTSINGCKWPVPIPKDSSLERVRIELLNYARSYALTREYSWLDVICLQQVGEEERDGSAQRLEEWMTDVPTIGHIYRHGMALVYFNGLGRPFHNGGYSDPRHWFSRTWTVQEAEGSPLLGGATPSYPSLKRQHLQASAGLKEFYLHFTSTFGRDRTRRFSQYIALMRKRHATKELDRISGLASVSFSRRLPIYDANQSNEGAWQVLVEVISGYRRAHLLFWYPAAGKTQHLWYPSWSQVMDEDTPAADSRLEGLCEIYYDEVRGEFHGQFIVWEDCMVHGLDPPLPGISSASSVVRTGSVILESQGAEGRQQHSVVAQHQIAIDETTHYTLLSPPKKYEEPGGKRFVLGVRNDARQFQKLCVLDFVSAESYSAITRIGNREDVILI